MIPKVKFKPVNIDLDKYWINRFTLGSWAHYVYKVHPKLKVLLKGVKGKKRRLTIIKKYLERYYSEHKEEFDRVIKYNQLFWNKINNKYFKLLEKILDTTWKIKVINAYVSANPICPRFLETHSFTIFFRKKKDPSMLTTAHECLHFLYFKKFHEVFPNVPIRTFNSPHLEWALSEILARPILNRDAIQELLKIKEWGYPEFQKVKIGKKSLLDHFDELYNKSLKRGESFEKFLRTAYKEAKKYRNKVRKSW
jgi:hypothetical protein